MTELVVIAQAGSGLYCTLAAGLVQYRPDPASAIITDEVTFK